MGGAVDPAQAFLPLFHGIARAAALLDDDDIELAAIIERPQLAAEPARHFEPDILVAAGKGRECAGRAAGCKVLGKAEAQRRAFVTETASRFETRIGEALVLLASSAGDLQAAAGSMSSTAAKTSQRAVTVASGAEEMSQGVQAVAASSEELSTAIDEVNRLIVDFLASS